MSADWFVTKKPKPKPAPKNSKAKGTESAPGASEIGMSKMPRCNERGRGAKK